MIGAPAPARAIDAAMITSERLLAFIAAASAAVLGTALASQFIGGLRPCELCHWQRYPYVATILIGIAGAVVARRTPRGNAAPAIAAVAGLIFLVGVGIAFFHVGV